MFGEALDVVQRRVPRLVGRVDRRVVALRQEPAQRLLGSVEDEGGGQRQHRELHLARDLGDAPVPLHARDRLPVPVHGVRRALEVGREDVPEQLAADRTAAARRADHRDAGRLEERAQRGDDRHVVAPVDAAEVARCGLQAQPHLDDAALALARLGEAGVREDAEHAAVEREHLGDERLDPARRGRLRELLHAEPRVHGERKRKHEVARVRRDDGAADNDAGPLQHDNLHEAVLEADRVDEDVAAHEHEERREAVLRLVDERALARLTGVGGGAHDSPSSSRVSATRASCSSRNTPNSSPVAKLSIQPLSTSASCHSSVSCISVNSSIR